jgi:hypothetical protein
LYSDKIDFQLKNTRKREGGENIGRGSVISQLPEIFFFPMVFGHSNVRVTECHQSDGFRRLENCLISSPWCVFRKMVFARFRHLHVQRRCVLSGRFNLNDFVRMRKMGVEMPN